jgi:crossover junction endodeoxyribonuclease RuvC
MRIMGVDPGTLHMGYGVLDDNGQIHLITCGVLNVPAKIPIEQRLHKLYQDINKIIGEYHPDEIAVEEPFVADNVKTALAIGRAQAAVIIAAVEHKLPVFRYPPNEIKQQVTNNGHSSKEQVMEMVKLQLNHTEPIKSNDTSDALAVALCHINYRHYQHMVSGNR